MRPLKVGVQLPEVERVVPWPELRDIAPPAGGSVFVACCSPRDDSKQVTLDVPAASYIECHLFESSCGRAA